ncbi:MAG: flagellar export protein FliJ [bacterium]
MFKFKFESLLNYKQSIEDKKQTEAKQEEMKLIAAKNIQKEYEQQKNTIIMQIQNMQTHSIDPKNISLYQNFLRQLNRKISSQKRLIGALRKSLEKKQQELISAMQDRKIIEKLKEKEKKSWERKMRAVEQKELDNLSNAKFYRQYKHQGIGEIQR